MAAELLATFSPQVDPGQGMTDAVDTRPYDAREGGLALHCVEAPLDAQGGVRPRRLHLEDGEILEVRGIDDRWYDVEANYFRVRLSDGSRALLRQDLEADRWAVVQHRLLDA